MNKALPPLPSNDINPQLKAGMQIATEMVAARDDKKEILRLFVKLVCAYYLKDEGTGIIRKRGRILAARRDLGSGDKRQLKRAKHGSTINEQHVTVIPIDKAQIVLLSHNIVDETGAEAIAKMAASFKVDTSNRAKYWLISIVAIALLFVPITDKVTGKGIVIGEQSYAVTATANGTINKVFVEAGHIEQHAPILNIETLIEGDIIAAKIDLQEINTRILEQGANSTENINVLFTQRRTAEQKIHQLTEQARSNEVLARVQGIIELKENLAGSVVSKGDPLGVIEKAEQKTITTEIAPEDWIPLRAGEKATFVPLNQSDPMHGTIESIPLNLVDGQVGKVYKVKVNINQLLPTGTFGTIILNGDKTTVGRWLFRKQIAWLIGVTGISINKI